MARPEVKLGMGIFEQVARLCDAGNNKDFILVMSKEDKRIRDEVIGKSFKVTNLEPMVATSVIMNKPAGKNRRTSKRPAEINEDLEMNVIPGAAGSPPRLQQSMQSSIREMPESSNKILKTNTGRSIKKAKDLVAEDDKENRSGTPMPELAKLNHPGFPNPEYMCYMNASLQALLAAEPVCNYLADMEHHHEKNSKILQAITCLSKMMRRDTDLSADVKLSNLIKCIGIELAQSIFKLDPSIQHDVHEFVDLLIEFLQKHEIKSDSEIDICKSLFVIESSFVAVPCPSCGNNVSPSNKEEHVIYRLDMNDAERNESIQSLIDKNLAVEFSERCCFNDIICTSQINSLPQVLLVGLNRYTNRQQKIKTPVEISSELVLAQYNYSNNTSSLDSSAAESINNDHSDVVYKLKGIVNHIGTTIRRGHYVAFVYDTHEQEWMHCDDKKVAIVDQSQALCDSTTCCYLLVYTKVEEPTSFGLSDDESLIDGTSNSAEDSAAESLEDSNLQDEELMNTDSE